MGPSGIAISAEGLNKCYKNTRVLENVSFQVKKGTIFSLLGSNGAGKTTTIKIMTTLLKADKGKVTVNGYDVMEKPDEVHESISLTGQYAAVDEVLTGFENLVMMGKLHHLQNIKGRARELLDYFGLKEAGNRRVSEYSGGMRRKLDIAMSLVSEPQVIFLDEPTTGLDPQSRRAMWKIIKSLNATGITIFLTTQYLDEAEQLADNIAILNNGSVIVQGTPEELKKQMPQGIIEFSFQNEKDLSLAEGLLKDYKSVKDEARLILTLYTSGEIKQLTEIFKILDSHHLAVESFTQKLPTLEDAFLTLIGEGERL